jgi:hypothetical protein
LNVPHPKSIIEQQPPKTEKQMQAALICYISNTKKTSKKQKTAENKLAARHKQL